MEVDRSPHKRASVVFGMVGHMQILAKKLQLMRPPKDDLLSALRLAKLGLKEGDIVAISSKVVSIGEGRTIPVAGVDKEKLIEQESDRYLRAPKSSRWRKRFTIAKGAMAGSAGIDESNGDGHYVLYPKDPFESAKRLRVFLMKTYNVTSLGVLITDSTSIPLRRGAVGFALAWDGIDPLRDYRGTKDLFGRAFKLEMMNVIDSLASAAGLSMGEGSERMPIAILRGVPGISLRNRSKTKDQLIVDLEDDVFAPFFTHPSFKWKR